MKGPCLLAWLFSSLGCWGLARPAPDAAQCQRAEHPVVSYEEIGPWLREFRAKDAVDFSQLTFDPGQKELIVGARNYLFRLQLEDLSLIQAVAWECDEAAKNACYSKGKSKEECQNYIRVLLVGGDRLFTCGTNAFTPVCTNRTLSNLTEVHDQISGMARCPYSPQHNSTALLTAGGELYAATAMDFPGRDPAIYRSLGALPPLRTAQYNSKWLNEPNFVSAYDIGNFTYFFFRENAVEHDCGKTVFSRAARVCKNDIGGRFLLEDTWTTFMKARLNCSRPGEVPFYYHELQSTFLLPELDLLYGIFTTNVNSIAASAVCVFNLSAISLAFNGPFKYQENSRSAWLPYPNPNPNFQCGTVDQGLYVNLTERNLQDAQKFILMQEVVQPVSPVPAFLEDGSRFSHVAVDVVQARDALVHILYLATDHGTIKKVRAPLTPTTGGCLLEEIELFPERRPEPVRSLRILHSQSALFVGLRGHVAKVPLRRCRSHSTRSACVRAQDPYCGWDVSMKKCTSLEESLSMAQWEQSISACPTRNLTVDGHFGPWSAWTPCTHADGGALGSCLCRTRSCDSPAPQCGGWQCQGPRAEIANCSRYCNEHLLCPPHVFWTGWGPWERCTAQCGGGIQARRRTCENGPDCLSGDFLRAGRYSAHTVNGAWSAWTSWSQCSRDCSRGIRSRKRVCNNPEPKFGGMPCLGPALEYQECNVLPCPEASPVHARAFPGGQRKLESWSEWSDWSECDPSGVQVRARQCVLLFPAGGQCSGNTTESRPCVFDSNFIPEVSVARSSSVEEKRCGGPRALRELVPADFREPFQNFLPCPVLDHWPLPSTLHLPFGLPVFTGCVRVQGAFVAVDAAGHVAALNAFNKNNLILEERNKYFNPHLSGKTYSNAYFTDLNNYDEY
ncbi:PREDICTED: semaphorin-5A [Condylura cristata]|uniref:semaphorin-5A n=1 Tax=Condylura cristata TaxID=143302 RepID=UPI000643944E|nr:PREDICTED: semaphorin-5A [Condylura cristata]